MLPAEIRIAAALAAQDQGLTEVNANRASTLIGDRSETRHVVQFQQRVLVCSSLTSHCKAGEA